MALLDNAADVIFSTQGRAGVPDGNVFLDVTDPANPLIELLDNTEWVDGANLFIAEDGMTTRALYEAIGEHRSADEIIRQYNKPAVGRFKAAGSYDILNNWQFATAADVTKLRGSGIRYLTVAGAINRVYFGPKSLNPILPSAQPYYQNVLDGPITNFTWQGDIDELVQVFGTTANGDAGAGDFDDTAYIALTVREWGYVHARNTNADSGFPSLDGFSGGFGIGQTVHPSTGTYTEADVLGGGAIAPWSTMSYLTEAAPVNRTGFNEADGLFAETIQNPAGGTLDEVLAFMDALARSAADIDDGTPSQIGKEVDVLYTLGQGDAIILKQGLFIEGLPGADASRLQLTDDGGAPKTNPALLSVGVGMSASAQAGPGSWYHAYIEDGAAAVDYNTAAAVTAVDKDLVEIKGLVGAQATINFDLNFSAAPGAGVPAATPYVIRFIVGGDPSDPTSPVENFTLITVDGTISNISTSVSNDPEQNV